MNKEFSKIAPMVLICQISLLRWSFAESSLEPPSDAFRDGMPVSHMKTINDVEPRVIITTLPFLITNTGSYYLTKPLDGTNGIHVRTDDVTIDLNGYSLCGDTDFPTYAIYTTDEDDLLNITIQNGTIGDWGGWGIYCTDADYSTFRNLTVELCEQGGIRVGHNCRVEKLTVTNTKGDGIRAGNSSVIMECISQNNEGGGICVDEASSIISCQAKANSGVGIVASVYCTLRDCTVVWNHSNGVVCEASCRILQNNVGDNGHTSNGSGIVLQGSGNRVEQNNITANDNHGILVHGVGNWIENNSIIDNRVGIEITGLGNLVIRNRLGNPINTNATFFIVPPGNHVAEPIGNLGFEFTNNNPWANIRLTETP